MCALLDDLAGDFCENRCILRASRALSLRGVADIRKKPGGWFIRRAFVVGQLKTNASISGVWVCALRRKHLILLELTVKI